MMCIYSSLGQELETFQRADSDFMYLYDLQKGSPGQRINHVIVCYAFIKR